MRIRFHGRDGLNRTILFMLCLTAKDARMLFSGEPLIFPLPESLKVSEASFDLTPDVTVLLPMKATENDRFLAQCLVSECAEHWGTALSVLHTDGLPPKGRGILLGSIKNSLIRSFCKQRNIHISEKDPGPEGYVLFVNQDFIAAIGSDDRGAFYGLQSLRQIVRKKGDAVEVQGLEVRDRPRMPFRGIRLFIPGRDNIPFLKRFIRDFMV